MELGAEWAGTYDQALPHELDAAITFAPSGDVVVAALKALRRGGTVAINAIHLDRIPPAGLRRPVVGAVAAVGGQRDPGRRPGVPGPGRPRGRDHPVRDAAAGPRPSCPGPAAAGDVRGSFVLVPGASLVTRGLTNRIRTDWPPTTPSAAEILRRHDEAMAAGQSRVLDPDTG